jgi:uncharacterized membrane protein YdjX (TVP38/TMEM64 family)
MILFEAIMVGTFGIILAAAIAGIGSGIGVAIGNAFYKAILEDKVNAFLDKKKHVEALKKMAEQPSKISEKIKNMDTPSINSENVLDKMLGRK